MKQQLLEEIDKRREVLERVIVQKEKSLQHVPPGTLRCILNGNRVQYYHRTDPKDTTGTFIRAKDRKLAMGLAQKDYDQRILKMAKKELKLIKQLEDCYRKRGIDDLYENLHPLRRELVIPICPTDEMYVNQWKEKEYVRKDFYGDTSEYHTVKGERVRSKSEIIIADTLFRMGVPYRYECPLYLEGAGTIHPDFTVLNVRKRSVYYWEHMGRMDDPDYCQKALKRISVYEQNEYYPGEKLIITQESSFQPINTRQIEGIINHFLL